MPEVSIIILTYNSANYISQLLESINKSHKDLKDIEILVVDNNSSDETISVSRKFDEVKVFETGKNLGFAKGINFGAKKANGKYLLFINPDSVFESGTISNMVNVLEKNEKAGIVGGKLLDKKGDPEKSAGRFFGLFETLLIILGLDERFGVRFSPKKESKVDFVSGGFMMVKKEVFEMLHGFDENFFMYVEDMELSYRAKKQGLETYFTHETVISHAGHGSSSRSFAIINIYKGILYFYKKHKNIFEYHLVRISLSLKAIIVYLLGVITNNNYYKKTYIEALRAIF